MTRKDSSIDESFEIKKITNNPNAVGVKGYKAFYKGLVNKNGMQYEEGKTYCIEDDPKYGPAGKGFHFCKRLEDALRYFFEEEDLEYAEVTGLGKIDEYHDHQFGFFNMYCTNIIRIDKVLKRSEILDMYLSMDSYRNTRLLQFLSLFPLTEEEINMFIDKFSNDKDVLSTIDLYQRKGYTKYIENDTSKKIIK